MQFANPRNHNVQRRILELYKAGKYPQEIQRELNLRYHQPVYRALHKAGIYVEKPARAYRKYQLTIDFFAAIDSEAKAYFLGMIAADGCVEPLRTALQLQRRDRDVLEKLVKAVKGTMPVKDITHEGRPHSRVRLNSVRMRADLIALGVTPAKSLTMTSQMFKQVPDALKSHFLRGYFDGDGNVFLRHSGSYGAKTSINIIGTKEFLTSTYGTTCVTSCALYKHLQSDIWHWKIARRSEVAAFLAYIYDDATVFMDRKRKYVCNFLGISAHVKPRELREALLVWGNPQPRPTKKVHKSARFRD
jgi:intein-encoded DNA endonuclease-like protein